MDSSLHYPDGEPCRVGDLVWLHDGLSHGHVAACGEELNITPGLAEDVWGNTTCTAQDAQRLTRTEELALELHFYLLDSQHGLHTRGNARWSTCSQQVMVGAGAMVWQTLSVCQLPTPRAMRAACRRLSCLCFTSEAHARR